MFAFWVFEEWGLFPLSRKKMFLELLIFEERQRLCG